MQGKGLGVQDRLFTHLECQQIEGVIGGQALGRCLIESDTPLMQGAKSKETTCDLFTRFWCAHRVTKHDCDPARQLIMYQSCSAGCQEMPVFRSQNKERQRVAAIESNQFRFRMTKLGMLVLWIGICYQ